MIRNRDSDIVVLSYARTVVLRTRMSWRELELTVKPSLGLVLMGTSQWFGYSVLGDERSRAVMEELMDVMVKAEIAA